MKPGEASDKLQSVDFLSKLIFQGYEGNFVTPRKNLGKLGREVEDIFAMTEEQFGEFLKLADAHHVTIRALRVLEKIAAERQKKHLQEWCSDALQGETSRIENAIEWLHAIIDALQSSGCPVTVIKSLDHWPDLGSDLDLYTNGDADRVIHGMQQKLQAKQEPRSWGDRLANKWNFRVPGLRELVEVHVRYLGQTGEQKLMAARVIERSVPKTVNGYCFSVPAPEERILISTLQRMYRHFYFRLCDMADVAALLGTGELDFLELQRGAEVGGIWSGAASFLVIVANYVYAFGGHVLLPGQVLEAACATDLQVHLGGDFLRVPMKPAAGLYGSQLLKAGMHRDLRAISRLPLLPPLAVSALVAYRLTGSDKGVW